jgi:uncharacterized FlaG/YvyC family protein
MEINVYQKADKVDGMPAVKQSNSEIQVDSISSSIAIKQHDEKASQIQLQERIPVLPAKFTSKVNFDKELNIMVVNIVEKESGEVIKTIPTEEMLQLMKKMNQMYEDNKTSGMLVDFKV